jgi:acetyl esterase/lipase
MSMSWHAGASLLVAMGLTAPASAQHLGPDELASMTVSPPTKVEAYGPDPLQFGELRVPPGKGPFPVAVIVHGGCGTRGFGTLRYMSPLAADLARKGIATWNIEYRQLGDAGAGWPGTFLDWAEGADHLRKLAETYPLDLFRVLTIGHSAGAQAALWLASRDRLPSDSPIRGSMTPLAVKSAVAVDGPGDIAGDFLNREVGICGEPVIENFMGGPPEAVASRYAQGNPFALLPVAAHEILFASTVLTPQEAADYQSVATARGARAEFIVLDDAGHFDMLSPDKSAGGKLDRAIFKEAGVAYSDPDPSH